MAEAAANQVRTYGNWQKPVSAGLLGLGAVGTGILGVGVLVAMVVMAFSLLWAVAVVVVFALFVSAVVVRDEYGQNTASKGVEYVGWMRTRRRGANVYRSGPLGRTGVGTCQLPGVATNLQLTEHADAYDRPFGLLHMPRTGHWTVVLAGEPNGAALVGAEQVSTWVAEWGEWLAAMNTEPGIQQVTITVESEPDTGVRLQREVSGRMSEDAPAFAREVMEETIAAAPAGSARVTSYVAITFSGTKAGSKRGGKRGEIARDIGARLGQLSAGLESTGLAAVRPCSAQQLCEMVHVAFDPGAVGYLDQARAAGTPADLSWDDVGPQAAESAWSHYAHDSGVSRTWSVSAPRTTVPAGALSRLLQPDETMARKRVTLVYSPIGVAEAARMVDADIKSAEFRQNVSRKPRMRDQKVTERAMRTAEEEAQGASLIHFAMFVTATVFGEHDADDQMQHATQMVEAAAGSAHCRPRPVYGSQDSAFAAALPLGLVIPAHMKVPQSLRQRL